MKIALASDHAGYRLKKYLVAYCQEAGHSVEDLGPGSEESVDYPDFAHLVAGAVQSKHSDFGILVCGSGIGMAMTANRTPGVRAFVATMPTQARLARGHNDGNVLCLGARLLGDALATEIVDSFLTSPFEGGRHQRRVDKIAPAEK